MIKLSVFFGIGLIALSPIGVPTQEKQVYEFNHEVKVRMKQFKKEKEKSVFDYRFLYPEDGEHMGIIGNFAPQGKPMEMKGVFNMAEKSTLMLMDQGGMKVGVRTRYEARGDQGEPEPANLRKTGRTKEILGYTAGEYEITSEEDDSYTLMWVSDEVDLPNFYEGFSSLNERQEMMQGEMPQGFMLEMTTWPKGKGTSGKYVMEVTEINRNKKNRISTEGYRIMNMPGR